MSTHIIKTYIFKCRLCDKGFDLTEDLSQHMKSDHNSYFCEKPDCKYTTISQQSLTRHMSTKHNEGVFTTLPFPPIDKDLSEVNKNVQKLLKCHLCHKHILKNHYIKHMKSDHNIISFICPELNCQFTTIIRSSFDKHLLTHQKESPKNCVKLLKPSINISDPSFQPIIPLTKCVYNEKQLVSQTVTPPVDKDNQMMTRKETKELEKQFDTYLSRERNKRKNESKGLSIEPLVKKQVKTHHNKRAFERKRYKKTTIPKITLYCPEPDCPFSTTSSVVLKKHLLLTHNKLYQFDDYLSSDNETNQSNEDN